MGIKKAKKGIIKIKPTIMLTYFYFSTASRSAASDYDITP